MKLNPMNLILVEDELNFLEDRTWHDLLLVTRFCGGHIPPKQREQFEYLKSMAYQEDWPSLPRLKE